MFIDLKNLRVDVSQEDEDAVLDRVFSKCIPYSFSFSVSVCADTCKDTNLCTYVYRGLSEVTGFLKLVISF